MGTVATLLLLESVTVKPFEPALPLRLTVPVEEFPPVTVEGFKLTDASDAAVIVSVAVCV